MYGPYIDARGWSYMFANLPCLYWSLCSKLEKGEHTDRRIIAKSFFHSWRKDTGLESYECGLLEWETVKYITTWVQWFICCVNIGHMLCFAFLLILLRGLYPHTSHFRHSRWTWQKSSVLEAALELFAFDSSVMEWDSLEEKRTIQAIYW
jgi:hypothetical protein